MCFCVLSKSELFYTDVPTALVIVDVESHFCNICLIVSLYVPIGLRMICGRGQMFDPRVPSHGFKEFVYELRTVID